MALQQDIARSHLETLIERITGVDRAVPDRDGDYLIRTQSAGFYARVDGADSPIFRVFSIVVDQVDKSPELFETLNDINAQLAFLRSMWIRGQVLIEGEMLALSAELADFDEVCRRVALATDRFGPELVARHGGKLFFETTKQIDYGPEPPTHPGYL